MKNISIEPLICDAGFEPRRAADLGAMGRHGWILEYDADVRAHPFPRFTG